MLHSFGQDTPRSPAYPIPVLSHPQAPPRSRTHSSRTAMLAVAAPDRGGHMEQWFLTSLLSARPQNVLALHANPCTARSRLYSNQVMTITKTSTTESRRSHVERICA